MGYRSILLEPINKSEEKVQKPKLNVMIQCLSLDSMLTKFSIFFSFYIFLYV